MIGTTRSTVGCLFRPFRNNGRPAYLNTPPMTEAKKIAAAAKSNPTTISRKHPFLVPREQDDHLFFATIS